MAVAEYGHVVATKLEGIRNLFADPFQYVFPIELTSFRQLSFCNRFKIFFAYSAHRAYP